MFVRFPRRISKKIPGRTFGKKNQMSFWKNLRKMAEEFFQKLLRIFSKCSSDIFSGNSSVNSYESFCGASSRSFTKKSPRRVAGFLLEFLFEILKSATGGPEVPPGFFRSKLFKNLEFFQQFVEKFFMNCLFWNFW